MSIDYDDKETDHILAEADILIADQPTPTPEIFHAVTSPTEDAGGTEGMAPCEGNEEELRRGEGLCQRPPPSISHFSSICW